MRLPVDHTLMIGRHRKLKIADDDRKLVSPQPKHPPRSGSMLSNEFLANMTTSLTAYYKPVYEAIRAKLVAETERRPGRTVEAWILAERECVMRAINHQRSLLALDPVGIATVERAERMAVGHSDYVSKYAHAAADLVFRKEPA